MKICTARSDDTAVTNKALSYIEMMQAVCKIGLRWFANDLSVTPR
jgi:hypothetical protein